MQVLGDDGVRIDVRVDGNANAPVVLLAGFPLTRDVWDHQARALANAHRVVRPDLRGVGATTVTDGPYLMESLAADVAAVLDALAIERAAIVGHSMGGYVALAFARMFAERVSEMVLVCSRLAADSPEQMRAREELAQRVERDRSNDAILDAYLPRLIAPANAAQQPQIAENVQKMAKNIDPFAAAALLRGMALRDDAHDIAPDLDFAVLMIAGGADAVVPLEETRADAACFPRGQVAVCQASGHLPMLEQPALLTGRLLAFLSE